MNHGFPGNSPCSVRKVRFFPAPPEILKSPSVTRASGAFVVVALDPRSRSGAGRRAGQVLALQLMLDVASSSRWRPAARWPVSGAAGGGGRGHQLAAAAGGALARRRRCRWWLDVVSSSPRRPVACSPGAAGCCILVPVIAGADMMLHAIERHSIL